MSINFFLIYLVYTPFFLIILFDRYFNGMNTSLGMLLVGILIILFNYKKIIKRHLYSSHFYLIIWIMLSTIWSANTSVTLNSAIMLMSVLLFTISFTLLFNETTQFIKYAFHFMLIVIFINLFIYIIPIVDSFTYDVRYGEVFHGLFAHKNGLGKAMTIFALFSYWLMYYSNKISYRMGYLFCFIGSTSFILLSKNSGSLGILLLLILVFHIFNKIKSAKLISFISLIAVMLPFYLVLSPPIWLQYIIVNIFERDLTYTGRIYIWNVLEYYINNNFIFGYGYQAFWSYEYLNSTSILNSIGFNPTHAHNGIIDTVLSIGLVGLILYLLILIKLWWRLFVKRENNKYSTLGTLLILLVVYNNIFEVDLIYPMSIIYVIQVLVYNYTIQSSNEYLEEGYKNEA
ncbi:O-antigen ligase family protein [Exiguobacterium sp. s16]|uniref:O-antigen ligase family protein n=1 Tax=Exiguobacterium sp. s16 TaxID=2751237 RepID=UPI001BEA595B|nr:O-antigen ligase family protein [Exiguobacterium sp. s16]